VAQITPSGSAQSNPERPLASGVLEETVPPVPPESTTPDEPPEAGGFLASTLAELRKVVWPSRQQLFNESIAVILMVGLSAASIAALDRFYRWVSIQVFR
jgi:preprotein translocase subunit SecE